MIELSTSSLKPTASTSAPIAPGAAAGGFMQTLAAFLDAAGGAPAVPTAAGSPDDRQTVADDGKSLPDRGDPDAHDPALIWLPVPLSQQLPTIDSMTPTSSVGQAQGVASSLAKVGARSGDLRDAAPVPIDARTILPGSPAKIRAPLGDLGDAAPVSVDASTFLPGTPTKARELPDAAPVPVDASTILPGSPATARAPLAVLRDPAPVPVDASTILSASPATARAPLAVLRDAAPVPVDAGNILPGSPAKARTPLAVLREAAVPVPADARTILPGSPAKVGIPVGVLREATPVSVEASAILPGSPVKVLLGDPREVARVSAGAQPGATTPAQMTGAPAATDATAAQSSAPVDASARETPRPISSTGVVPGPSPTDARTAQPAGQVFAAAIAAASGFQQRPARADDRAEPGATATIVAAAQVDIAHRPVVQPTSEARHVPLDLRDDRGLLGMIDRIEVLRDDANARDTRIRLVPDALGSINLSVRKDGDTVHVHFTAENQTTRTLLTEAQPRLAELAEARGVKLGGATVDAGSGGGANHHPRFEPARAPASAAAIAIAADSEMPNDQRLA